MLISTGMSHLHEVGSALRVVRENGDPPVTLFHCVTSYPAAPGDCNLDAMQTIVRVNGKPSLQFKTNDMLFGIAHFISKMTQYLTLYPGDVIWMGTDGSSPDLKAGDIVDVEITGIGTLTNPFVAEK